MPCAAQISSQYIIPVVSGSTEPDMRSTAISSSSSSPASMRPSKIVTRASHTRPITTAGGTPRRVPRSIASFEFSRAPAMSPHMKRS